MTGTAALGRALLAHGSLCDFGFSEIFDSRQEELGVVLEKPDPGVAVATQQPSYCSRFVAVVDTQVTTRNNTADRKSGKFYCAPAQRPFC